MWVSLMKAERHLSAQMKKKKCDNASAANQESKPQNHWKGMPTYAIGVSRGLEY
jgi:hypothetical protein